ncbi:MAG: chromosomal replication initiator protein DnaA [Metamycoplasmataceae bacterium]
MNHKENKIFFETLIKEIEKKIDDQMLFALFFKELEFSIESKTNLYVLCPNNESLKYIKKYYTSQIEIIAKSLNEKIENIFFENKENSSLKKENSLDLKSKSKNLNPKINFSNYVIGDFNSDIVKASKKIIASNQIIFSPVFIYGKSGFGKTHFLQAIGNKFHEKNMIVNFVSANDFTNDFVKSLKTNNQDMINDFINEFKNYDVLLFDDIQQYASRTATLSALFTIINYFIEKNKQIFICADREPDLLGGFEDRFITRFQGGLTFEIKNPSTLDLEKIIKFKLEMNGFDLKFWDAEAFQFLIRNYSTSIRNIEGAINKIIFDKNEDLKEYYDEKKMKDIFKSAPLKKELITPERIIKKTCEYYNIPINKMISKSREKNIVLARDMCIWILKDILKLKLKEIGELMNGRDHSTILFSLTKIEKKLNVDSSVDLAIKSIKREIKKIS